MKKNLLYVLMAAFAFTFTACSDDDDDPIYKPEELSKTFGVDEGTLLNLSYSGGQLVGKQVKFETANSRKGTLTLIDVVPGQPMMVIDNVELVEGANQKEYTFAGESPITRADVGSVKYDGSIRKDTLNLDVTVTFSDPNGWAGTYKLADYTENAATGALYLEWAVDGREDLQVMYHNVASVLGSMLLPQCLKTITLDPDGNIRAEYNAGKVTVNEEMMMGMMMGMMMPEGNVPSVSDMAAFAPQGIQFVKSPANVAYWFENNGQLYVKLDIPSIMAFALSQSGTATGSEALVGIVNQALNGNPQEIKALIGQMAQNDSLRESINSISDQSFETALYLIKNGIPMNVYAADGHTHLCLDKAILDPIMKGTKEAYYMDSDLMKIWMIMVNAAVIPESANGAMLLLMNLPTNWSNTIKFNLGLDLVKQ